MTFMVKLTWVRLVMKRTDTSESESGGSYSLKHQCPFAPLHPGRAIGPTMGVYLKLI
jgi:hypothetical protein